MFAVKVKVFGGCGRVASMFLSANVRFVHILCVRVLFLLLFLLLMLAWYFLVLRSLLFLRIHFLIETLHSSIRACSNILNIAPLLRAYIYLLSLISYSSYCAYFTNNGVQMLHMHTSQEDDSKIVTGVRCKALLVF